MLLEIRSKCMSRARVALEKLHFGTSLFQNLEVKGSTEEMKLKLLCIQNITKNFLSYSRLVASGPVIHVNRSIFDHSQKSAHWELPTHPTMLPVHG
eukprot:COSAG05_NODE_3922_length_1773_cov_1.270012_1_plen_95_part_10